MYQTDAYQYFQTGVHLFTPEDPAAYAQGKPCRGFGIIRYPEGSVYYGDVYFDGTNYNKWGFGRQDLWLSDMGALDPERKLHRAFYIGEFDYRETDWIYGNGIFYFVDENNRPACFVKGFYEGLAMTGPYTGELTGEMLADGYTLEMEAFFDHWNDVFQRQLRRFSHVKTLENLMIGDSYFEFWNYPEFAGEGLFYDNFPNERNLNLGIGGTCFNSWLRFLPEVTVLPQPKRIFLNLGFNDIHRYKDPQKAYRDYVTVLTKLKAAFPDAEYYLLNVVQCPLELVWEQQEETFNAMTRQSARELGVHILDMRTVIREAGGLTKAFASDQIHLNPLGYAAMASQIRTVIGQ